MKRNNLSTFYVKAALFGIAVLSAPTAAFAQITLDLGVLAEDPVTEVKTTTSVPVKKTDPAKPATKPKPAKPAAKPVVKSAAKPAAKKPQKKETVQVKEKYQVKETHPKDDHDRLKPHRAPVPDVKVLASSKDGVSEEEEELLETAKKKKTSSPKEPKLSKHFLKQQQKNEERSLQAAGDIFSSPAPQKETEAEKPRFVTPQQLKKEARQTVEAETAVVKENAAPEPVGTSTGKVPALPISEQAETVIRKTTESPVAKPTEKIIEKPVLTFSVFPVSETLTQAERSEKLMKEIPSDSATVKALSGKKALYDIFRFEPKALELTPEMQTALDKIASILKKDRKKRLIIYSYAAADASEPGKERQYALRRALMVRSYLIVQGIHSLRMELRSQGQKGAGDAIPDRTDLVLQDR